jgi:hypothetical protein
MKAFKKLCEECGKVEVSTYDLHRKVFCSRVCESNWRYKRKFLDKDKNLTYK